MKFAQTTVAGRVVIAHVLRSTRMVDDDEMAEIQRDLVAVTTALEGHADCSFAVQWLCDPRPDDPRGGVIEVAVLTAVGGTPDAARVEEIADDVLDLLNGPPEVWRFELEDDDAALARLVDPLEPVHLAGVVRREAPLRPDARTSGVGFGAAPVSRPESGPQLWSMWTFGPPSIDSHRLSAGLLVQEAPVCVRMAITPTQLTGEERDLLEELVAFHAGLPERQLSTQASLRTLEAMLYLRPLFEARCVVASPEPLSSALLSTIGHTLSEPTPHDAPNGILSGGYAVMRPPAHPHLAEVYGTLGLGPVVQGLASPGLERLRHLLGVWEASNLFRLPVAGEEGAPGMRLDERPQLRAVLDALPSEGAVIGTLLDRDRPIAIGENDRLRHTYVAGQTGTGKSTLLLNMAVADIAAGHGVCVIDPHGDLLEDLMCRIPPERIDDVVLIDPADEVAVPGVNLIEAESDHQRRYLVSESANMMYALFDPKRTGIIGPRFESMMRNAMLLLEHVRDVPGSFLDVSTIFADPEVRKFLSAKITDPHLAEYWLGEYPASLRSNESGEVVSWFRSKFEVFRTSRALRSVIGQARSTVSFTDVLENRRILLVNLSKGSLGEYDSKLLGHIVVMKLWAAVLERTSVPADQRHPFFFYIDEFQNVTTDSLDVMLAEGRKYGVGLTLANQFFDQLTDATKNAILGNVGTKLSMRLGPHDAKAFSEWLGETVEASELSRLPNRHVVAALSPGGIPTSPVLVETHAPPAERTSMEAVRAASRRQWARPVAQVDREFTERWAVVPGSFAAKARKATAPPPTFADTWRTRQRDRDS
ncbi:MAG: type IV secretion system DNA-binding domain-containing protein [Aeromicrobium sp.]|uniref:type IV secretory system conjugative DNA transfer family protein n=1 Tax=Aeromicrobium sp. TaxID=1871063 RepID=UPI0039E5CD6F